jgi:copper chaperone CopZ
MASLSLQAPGMWADHHVLTVHEALAQLAGVEKIETSALRRTVRVSYDPTQVDPDRLAATIRDSGCLQAFSVDESSDRGEGRGSVPGCSTTTNPADISMSGDFRRY